MFYNADMLTKRGPLARVWMASHLSSKITKQNMLTHSIPASVKSIMGESLLPMALRLSGQLLLGVARIYSRQAKYLLDDCSETLSKVKKAFKPGQVDLDEPENVNGQNRGGAAITLGLQEGGLEDILNQFNYDDNQWELTATNPNTTNAKSKKLNISKAADISLPENDFGAGGWGNDDYGMVDFDMGIDGGIGTQDMFDADFELGILDDQGGLLDNVDAEGVTARNKRARDANDDGEDERDISVEVGRDAASVHASDRLSNADFPIMEDGDLGGMDYQDLDYDQPLVLPDDMLLPFREKTPGAHSAHGSVLGSIVNGVDMTPRTAADLAKAQQKQQATKAKKLRKQVVDSVIELDWEAGRDKSTRFKEPSFLPSSRLHLRLLELESDSSTFVPRAISNTTELFAPQTALAPSLEQLYVMPTRRQRIKAEGRELKSVASPSRQRLGQSNQDDQDMQVELGRDRALSFTGFQDDHFDDSLNREFGGEGWNGQIEGDDMGGQEVPIDYDDAPIFQFNLDEQINEQDKNKTPKTSPRKKIKTNSQIGMGSDYIFDEDLQAGVSQGPLVVFDGAYVGLAGVAQSVSHEQQTATQSLAATEEEEVINGITGGAGKIKWSKNTIKAIEVLRDELQPDEDDDQIPAPRKRSQKTKHTKPKTMQFDQVAEQATRHAASAFFFELLVLGTRECVRIDQQDTYGTIQVQAKDRLWEVVDGLHNRGLVVEASQA
ncbi:sister chromatid cohesion protein 1 [Microbotryomycetes sp. JL221]|nr:sister chromatid cohesion protein 1 [Microbotryomycetes sp. JL221]